MLPTLIAVELLKLKRSKVLRLAVAAPLFTVALQIVSFLTSPLRSEQMATWELYLQQCRAVWAVFGFSLMLACLAALALGMEAENWKLLLAQPVVRRHVFWTKLLSLMALAALAQFLLFAGSIAGGLAVGLSGGIPWGQALLFAAAVPAAFPVIAFQFALSLRFRSFLVPVAVGLMGHFVCMIGFNLTIEGYRPGAYLPWAFNLKALQVSGPTQTFGFSDLLIAGAMGSVLAMGAQIWFERRDVD